MKTNRAVTPVKQQGLCTYCGGKGRIADTQHRGKRKRTKPCFQCRGTGNASSGYMTKEA